MFNRARARPDCRCHALAARSRTLAIALAGGMLAIAAQADTATAIWQIDDAPDEIHLSDRADAGVGVQVRRLVDSAAAPRRSERAAAGGRFADIVRSVAATERLSPALIDAVIAVESAYQVHAVSRRGASGLMQLMPATARLYGVTDIFDPAQNIAAGAHHLRGLLDRYGQDVTHALAAYNAGAGAVTRAALERRAWPNAETAAYVPAVLGRYAARRSTEPPDGVDDSSR